MSSPAAPVLIAAASLSLAACDQPKWREKASPVPATADASSAAAPKGPAVPTDPAGAPAPPPWAQAVMGKPLREAFPKTGICKGNTDMVLKTYAGQPAGAQVHGWGWDADGKAPVQRVVLVDKVFKIVGAGAGGVPRPDVPASVPQIQDGNTGWNADVTVTAGLLDAYGVVGDGDAVCPLGHIELPPQ